MYLAASGVGRIGIVDFDVVDFTNLQRQVIHGTKDVGRKKLDSAADSMLDINPYMQVDKFDTALTSENALDIIKDYDMVVDGTDNFPTRYLINDACVLLKKPNVYGSIFRFEGQATVFAYPGGTIDGKAYGRGRAIAACIPSRPLRDLVPSCAEGGVLGILPGIIGLIQATEAVKLMLGIGEPLIGRLVLYDALSMRFREMKVRRNPECPVCGDHPTITRADRLSPILRRAEPRRRCSPWPLPAPGYVSDTEIDAVALKAKLDRGDKFQFIDVREPHEYQIASIPGAKLIPLNDVPKRVGELDPDAEVIVHCKMGGRSAKAADFLRSQGFKHVKNMLGGITGVERQDRPERSEVLTRYARPPQDGTPSSRAKSRDPLFRQCDQFELSGPTSPTNCRRPPSQTDQPSSPSLNIHR